MVVVVSEDQGFLMPLLMRRLKGVCWCGPQGYFWSQIYQSRHFVSF